MSDVWPLISTRLWTEWEWQSSEAGSFDSPTQGGSAAVMYLV